MNLFYIDTRGIADSNLPIYDGRHGDWQINIMATGVTAEMVDWQLVGLMSCHNVLSGHHRTVGLVWDESRILTDYDGVSGLTYDEEDALTSAGFNLYNFANVLTYHRWSERVDEDATVYDIDRAAHMHQLLDDAEEADKAQDFDTVSFLMDYEGGALDEDEVVAGFQHMLDTGIVWQLQGSYGRTAANMIEAGLIYRKGER